MELIFPKYDLIIKNHNIEYTYISAKYKIWIFIYSTATSSTQTRTLHFSWKNKNGIPKSKFFEIDLYGYITPNNKFIRAMIRCKIFDSMQKYISSIQTSSIKSSPISQNIFKIGEKYNNISIAVQFKKITIGIFTVKTTPKKIEEVMISFEKQYSKYVILVKENSIEAPEWWIKRNTLNKILKFILLIILTKENNSYD